MSSWPTIHSKEATSVLRKGKHREEASIEVQVADYPVVEYGGLTSANLNHEGRRLHWTFLSEERTDKKLVLTRDAVKVFPSTKSLPHKSTLGIKQVAEQTSHFLRLHYPDVDLPSEVIRDHIAEDALIERKLSTFDPYIGNTLTTFSRPTERGELASYVAFPMGETSSELNITPLLHTKEHGITFVPSTSATWAFPIPILQLVSESRGAELSTTRAAGTVVAARTYSSTYFLEVDNNGESSKPIKETRETPSALFVNDQGTIFECELAKGKKTVRTILASPSPDLNEDFFRLTHGSEETTLFLLTGSRVHLADLRTADYAQEIHCRKSKDDFLTSLDYSSDDGLLRVCSTSEVLWIDQRHSKKPLFSVKHGRRFDRHLQVDSMLFDDRPLTFLNSRRNGLVTVYDVSRGDESLAHLFVPPYTLPSLQVPGSTRPGHAFFRHPEDTKDNVCFIQLSDRGSVHRMDFQYSSTASGSPIMCDGGSVKWSEDVYELEKDLENRHAEPGPMGERRYEETDLTDAYTSLFCGEDSGDNPNATYDVLDTMPVFWQKQEAPVEHILTTFDIAFRSGSEPRDPSRDDFFTGTPLDSVRGYRALKQGRIPLEAVIKRSSSHWNILPILRHLVPDVHEDTEELLHRLSRYDLASSEDRPAASFRRETEAREQLALDLALSSDLFSSRVVKTEVAVQEDDFETVSRATEAMSIGVAEPPEMKFRFLDPISLEGEERARKSDEKAAESESGGFLLPLGVRLLLSDWTIGTDPQEYMYVDPYDASTAPSMHTMPRMQEKSRKQAPLPSAATGSQGGQPQRPPPVVAGPSAPPPIASSQLVHPPRVPSLPQSQQVPPRMFNGASQPTQAGPPMSQNHMSMPSTQVLPGPYGGRPEPVKKKPAKKRVGGF
ncbi:unnamed protein product [Somion occarium]|uniref:RRN6 K-rich C-terminal domain-containing protein n=1 Tax=Somion occarium TaxID=3059160 RepID=A0ABP1DE16_9APHY